MSPQQVTSAEGDDYDCLTSLLRRLRAAWTFFYGTGHALASGFRTLSLIEVSGRDRRVSVTSASIDVLNVWRLHLGFTARWI